MKVTALAWVSLALIASTSCSATGSREPSADARLPTVAAVPPVSRPGETPTGPSSAITFAPLECGTPSEALVRRTLDAIPVGDRAVTASTLVPAVTTESGDWYIVGVDRNLQVGDGTVYPDRSARALAVTDADPRHATVIRLGSVASRDVSWRRVSWTGETLAQGKRAAAKALSCLDGQR